MRPLGTDSYTHSTSRNQHPSSHSRSIRGRPQTPRQDVISGGAASTTLKSVTAQLSADVRKNTQIHMDLQSPDTFGIHSTTNRCCITCSDLSLTRLQGIHIILTSEDTKFYKLPPCRQLPDRRILVLHHSGRPSEPAES
mgnify:CR=1 FL=1